MQSILVQLACATGVKPTRGGSQTKRRVKSRRGRSQTGESDSQRCGLCWGWPHLQLCWRWLRSRRLDFAVACVTTALSAAAMLGAIVWQRQP